MAPTKRRHFRCRPYGSTNDESDLLSIMILASLSFVKRFHPSESAASSHHARRLPGAPYPSLRQAPCALRALAIVALRLSHDIAAFMSRFLAPHHANSRSRAAPSMEVPMPPPLPAPAPQARASGRHLPLDEPCASNVQALTSGRAPCYKSIHSRPGAAPLSPSPAPGVPAPKARDPRPREQLQDPPIKKQERARRPPPRDGLACGLSPRLFA